MSTLKFPKFVPEEQTTFVIPAKINNEKLDLELDTDSPVFTIKKSEVRGRNISSANFRLKAYNWSAINVKGSIKLKNILCNDKLLKNVKFIPFSWYEK